MFEVNMATASTVGAQLVGAEVEDIDGLGRDALGGWTSGDANPVSTGVVGRVRAEFGGGLCWLAFEARVEEFGFDAEAFEEMGVGRALSYEL